MEDALSEKELSFHLQSIKINCKKSVHDGMFVPDVEGGNVRGRIAFVELFFPSFVVYHFKTIKAKKKSKDLNCGSFTT
jgi:hypothetical protein